MDKLKAKLKNVPKEPGVYEFKNKDGEVIYVGKAKNLRARLGQYLGGQDERPQIPYLLAEAADFDYTVVNNELESLYLENTVIKQHLPKYNIMLRDDKNYAFIKIDYSTEIPQITIARKIHKQGKALSVKGKDGKKLDPSPFTLTPKYFGPYSAAYKIRNTLNLVRRIFPYCSADKVSARPCFYYYLHRCPGVCIGKTSLDEYRQHLKKIEDFLAGDTGKIKKELAAEMKLASSRREFEKAARLRDQCNALELLEEKQTVIMPKAVSWDVVSVAADQGYACVNLFKVREGKLYDKENFVFETSINRRHSEGVQPTEESQQKNKEILRPSTFAKASADKSDALGTRDNAIRDVLQKFLEQYYLETSGIPKCIYVPAPPEDSELIQHIAASRFNKKAGVIVPQKGKPAELIKLGATNAQEYLRNWLQSQAGHLDKINAALNGLRDVLQLPDIPQRIECYDISNIQGTNAVGSMVVFKQGLPAKSEYRKFKIKTKQTPDDFAMMKEILSRRLQRSMNQELGIMEKRNWALPDLIVIDGGKGQLGVAASLIHNSKFQIPVIGLAKRIEEIFLPNQSEPIILSHDNPALQLLQRLRDEAHRFGITYHRALRSKQAVKSALDDIPGIGPKTKKLLKQKFGTVANIRKASLDELAAVVGKQVAQSIQQSL